MGLAEVIGSVIHSIAGSFGLVSNLILIYLLLFESPKEMKTYSLLLLNMAFSDTVTCCCALFVEPRIIPHLEDVIYVANGVCNFFQSKTACWIGYESLLCFFVYQNWSLLGNFVYRLYILYFPAPKPIQIIPCIIITAIPTIIGEWLMIPYAIEMVSFPVEEKLLSLYPDLDITGKVVFIAHNANVDYRPYTISVMVLAFIFPFTIAVLIIRWIILRKLKHTTLMSTTAKVQHRSFLMALSLQAALPFIYMIGSIIFMFQWLSGKLLPPVEYMVPIFLGSIAAVNPVFSLYFVYPFRKRIRLFFKHSSQNNNQGLSPLSFTPSSQKPFTGLSSSGH